MLSTLSAIAIGIFALIGITATIIVIGEALDEKKISKPLGYGIFVLMTISVFMILGVAVTKW